MRLGCCAYSYRDALNSGDLDLNGFLHKCVDMKLDGVELTAYYFKDLSREALLDTKMKAYRMGLQVSGTAVGNAFTSPDADHRRSQVQMVLDWIDHSVTLGAPGLRVFAGSIHDGTTERQAFDWTVECLKECCARATDRGVMIALENHGGITSTAEQTLALLNAVGSDWMGLNLDVGNFAGDPYSQIERAASFAVTAHAKVSAAGSPLDFDRIVQILAKAGYCGYLNVEYEEPGDAGVGVPAFMEVLAKALANAGVRP